MKSSDQGWLAGCTRNRRSWDRLCQDGNGARSTVKAQRSDGGATGKTVEEKKKNGSDALAIKAGQEARGSHDAAFSSPARRQRRPRARLEAERSSSAMRCLPRALFIVFTILPLGSKSKLLPILYNNSKISKNKSCSKFKVL